MIETRHIKIQKSARYSILRPKQEAIAVLYVTHGYKQLAPYFVKQFQVLADLGVIVVAPEGLHRFYIEGYSGRVGASWMTKEDRESDIVDYVAYLNTLSSALESEIGQLPVHLLGFSQGGPTACRWLAGSQIDFRSMLLYSTVFPNDFDFSLQEKRLNRMNCSIAFGDSDQFAPEKTILEKMNWLNNKGIDLNLIRFKGGHEIQPEVLSQWWQGMQKR